MDFKIPKTVQIAGFTIRVENRKDLHRDGECLGVSHIELNEILLDDGIVLERAQECFVHEVLHFIDFAWNTELTESQVKRLATGLYQVIRQL